MYLSVVSMGLLILIQVGDRSTSALAEDSATVNEHESGRHWTRSVLDTLQSHHWMWQDDSFKEEVPQQLDSALLLVEPPRLKKANINNYPPRAFDLSMEADVRVRALVDKKGKVRAAYIQVDSGNEGFGFEEAALKAAQESKWDPGKRGDQAMPMWVSYNCQFRTAILSNGEPITKYGIWDWGVESEMPSLLLSDSVDVSEQNQPKPGNFFGFEAAPEMLKRSTPVYPERARQQGQEGRVQVQVLVDRRGKVIHAKIVESANCQNCGFEESALRAALECKWKPAMVGGNPAPASITYPIAFRMH